MGDEWLSAGLQLNQCFAPVWNGAASFAKITTIDWWPPVVLMSFQTTVRKDGNHFVGQYDAFLLKHKRTKMNNSVSFFPPVFFFSLKPCQVGLSVPSLPRVARYLFQRIGKKKQSGNGSVRDQTFGSNAALMSLSRALATRELLTLRHLSIFSFLASRSHFLPRFSFFFFLWTFSNMTALWLRRTGGVGGRMSGGSTAAHWTPCSVESNHNQTTMKINANCVCWTLNVKYRPMSTC